MERGRRVGLVLRAAAELAVIVVGVMIALAADRWLGAVDEADLERDYLEALIRDLQQDSLLLVLWERTAEDNLASGGRVLSALRGDAEAVEDPLQLAMAIEAFNFTAIPDYTTDTWEDLVATGNLRALEPTLAASLSGYYNTLDLVHSMDVGWTDFSGSYGHAVLSTLSAEQRSVAARAQLRRQGWAMEPRLPQTDVTITSGDAAGVVRRLQADPDVEVAVGHHLVINEARAEGYGRLRVTCERLLSELRRHLEERP